MESVEVIVTSKGSKKRKYVLFLVLAVLLFTVVTIAYYYVGLYTRTPPSLYENIEIEGVTSKEMLAITVNYKYTGTSDANVTNIFVDNKPLSSYSTFVDVYDSSGNSIKNLLNGTGYTIPVGKEGRFVIVFTKDAFESGQLIHISINTMHEGFLIGYWIP